MDIKDKNGERTKSFTLIPANEKLCNVKLSTLTLGKKIVRRNNETRVVKKERSPSVRRLNGRVIILTIGSRIRFRKESIIPAKIYA
jgi:hypothetical protein